MLRRCTVFMIILSIISFMLAGCTDSSEVDDNVYVVAIGLDKGVNNKVVVTVQYPTYRKSKGGAGGGGGDTGQGSSNLHSVEAPSLLEAIDLLNMAVSRRIQLTHTKVLVISEEFAREGMGAFLAPLARFRGARRTMFVVVTRGSALEFIQENKTFIGESITKTIELMLAQSKNTGFFPMMNFHYFYRDIISTYGNAIAAYAGVNKRQEIETGGGKKKSPLVTHGDLKPGEMPRIGIAKREYVGTALFNGDKMVGSLNPYETRYMLMLRGLFQKGIMTIEDRRSPGNGIIVSIRNGRRPKITGRFDNGRPVIDLDLNIEADIGSIHSRINYESTKLIEDLNNQLEVAIKKGVEETIEKTKKEYRTDVFLFGKKLAGYFPTIQEWQKYDWLSHFPDTKVNVKVEVNVRRTGLNIDSSPIIEGPQPE
ncbi:MAG: Ger(x)C family spore germination protein [Bacillota bacterium]|nr:Ger(x)C family spore germination protein [Bacillota bacterium]